jgi:methylated-DNA-[protein]-cysteine S-methyltransferase
MKKHPAYTAQARTETPLGPVLLAATERGLAGVWFDGQAHHPGAIDAPVNPAQPFIAQAVRELRAYFAQDAGHGAAASPFSVPLDAAGTEFQRAVWAELLRIAPGATSSYGEIARRSGRPAAFRAVGAAVGRNPLSVIVPCHRVLGSDGSMTGYAGGLPRKQALLLLEGALAAVT